MNKQHLVFPNVWRTVRLVNWYESEMMRDDKGTAVTKNTLTGSPCSPPNINQVFHHHSEVNVYASQTGGRYTIMVNGVWSQKLRFRGSADCTKKGELGQWNQHLPNSPSEHSLSGSGSSDGMNLVQIIVACKHGLAHCRLIGGVIPINRFSFLLPLRRLRS